MEIIPVIDVMKGRVVQAKGGVRAAYQPLQSQLTQQTDTIAVVADLLAYAPFKTLYMADLDAIMGRPPAHDLYQALTAAFPQLMIYLDVGIKTVDDWHAIAGISGLQAVIGSETLQDKTLLSDELIRRQGILSLDYRAGNLLGSAHLPDRADWPEKTIVMSLDSVGANKGPNVDLLSSLRKRGERQWLMAGGVRDNKDIDMLREQGVAGVLVASALHSGKLKI